MWCSREVWGCGAAGEITLPVSGPSHWWIAILTDLVHEACQLLPDSNTIYHFSPFISLPPSVLLTVFPHLLLSSVGVFVCMYICLTLNRWTAVFVAVRGMAFTCFSPQAWLELVQHAACRITWHMTSDRCQSKCMNAHTKQHQNTDIVPKTLSFPAIMWPLTNATVISDNVVWGYKWFLF